MEGPSINRTYRPSILVVENDPIVASYVKEILVEAEYRVAGVASSASEALALLGQDRPDLAIVDVGLTGPLDGIELARLMRIKAQVPTIFLSGWTDARTKSKAAAAQPLAFLDKPFAPSTLFNAVEEAACMTNGFTNPDSGNLPDASLPPPGDTAANC